MGCRRVRPADFRSDIEGFITMEAVQDCVEMGCRERPYDRRYE
jgi:hypothetical protein